MCIKHIGIIRQELCRLFVLSFCMQIFLYKRGIEENIFLSSPHVPGISKVIWQFERPGFKCEFLYLRSSDHHYYEVKLFWNVIHHSSEGLWIHWVKSLSADCSCRFETINYKIYSHVSQRKWGVCGRQDEGVGSRGHGESSASDTKQNSFITSGWECSSPASAFSLLIRTLVWEVRYGVWRPGLSHLTGGLWCSSMKWKDHSNRSSSSCLL